MRLPCVVHRQSGNALAIAGLLLVAACSGLPYPAAARMDFPAVDSPFLAEGRLSARHGSDAVAVHFTWDHRPPRDELVVTSPLGQTIAELSGDRSTPRVEIRTAEGRREEAPDWPALTERALGFPFPVTGLSAWIRAAPHADATYTIEVDRAGRVSVLRQDGWEVVYDYADDTARTPARIRLGYPEFEIRVVVDQWR